MYPGCLGQPPTDFGKTSYRPSSRRSDSGTWMNNNQGQPQVDPGSLQSLLGLLDRGRSSPNSHLRFEGLIPQVVPARKTSLEKKI